MLSASLQSASAESFSVFILLVNIILTASTQSVASGKYKKYLAVQS